MDLNTALAQATANGWNDDTRFTPTHIAHQVSNERDGFIAAVSVTIDGIIKWGLCSMSDTAHGQRGTAPTVPAAIAACDNALAATLETLF